MSPRSHPFHSTPPAHERHGIPHMILPTICFCEPLRYGCWHPFSTSPCPRGDWARPIWELRKNIQFANHLSRPKLGFVSVCLEMCPIFICFQLFSSIAVSLRLSYLLLTCRFLFIFCFRCCLPAAADQIQHCPKVSSYISVVSEPRSNRRSRH
jgi:hypothetical protein